MCISARAWEWHGTRKAICGCTTAGTTRACSSSIPPGSSSASGAQGIYGFEFAHKVRVDSEDNVWAVDEGTNMVIKFNPEGKVLMVLGRRPEAVEGIVRTAPGRPAAR